MAEEKLKYTQQGYEKLIEERDALIARRTEVADHLREARSYGDLSENAEYDAAKNENAELEAEIIRLDNLVNNAVIVDESEITTDKVNLGHAVKILNIDTGDELTYTVTSPNESDPLNGFISYESPIGDGLMGRALGEEVEVEAPVGLLRFKILEIA